MISRVRFRPSLFTLPMISSSAFILGVTYTTRSVPYLASRDLLSGDLSKAEVFSDEDDFEEDDDAGSSNARGRLSMQRVMKNAGKENGGIDIADSALEDLDDEQLSEPLFDEDDDMEYSFLGNRRRR